jgi:hypothetical protein
VSGPYLSFDNFCVVGKRKQSGSFRTKVRKRRLAGPGYACRDVATPEVAALSHRTPEHFPLESDLRALIVPSCFSPVNVIGSCYWIDDLSLEFEVALRRPHSLLYTFVS